MKKHLIVFLSSAILISMAFGGEETSKKSPLDEFHSKTSGLLYVCKLRFELAQVGGNSEDADYFKCISSASKDATPTLKTAMNSVSKKPAASAALKKYYAAWLAAMKGISPGSGEIAMTYATRQRTTEQRLDELWATVEMENAI